MIEEIEGAYRRAEQISPGIVERAEKKQEELIKFALKGEAE